MLRWSRRKGQAVKLTSEQYALAKHGGIRAANHELTAGEQIIYTSLSFCNAMGARDHEATRRVLECAMYDYEQNHD